MDNLTKLAALVEKEGVPGVWHCPFCETIYEIGRLVQLMLHTITDHPNESLSDDIAKVLFKVALAALRSSDSP